MAMDLSFQFRRPGLTVSELNRYLHQLVLGDDILQDVWVMGEISNLSRPASGHLYFTLKDSNAAIRCVIWRSAAQRLKLVPQDGMAVEVHGSIDYYETGGQIQINVTLVRLQGEGALYQEFLRLKALLEAEGLFAPERKRPIPGFPHRIGIVTSPSGAALQDMLKTIKRRFPLAEVIVSPTPVQGEEAPLGIVKALDRVNRLAHPDVILLARGGGSIEDLWAFNDERVARAIVASQAPVISGVGHETDFTIADFAADLRAPTPTAAAELATPDQVDLRTVLDEKVTLLARELDRFITDFRWQLKDQVNRLHRFSPLHQIQNNRQRLDGTVNRSALAMDHSMHLRRILGESLQTRLASLNPQAVLNRGFAIVTFQENKTVVSSVSQVTPGDELNVRVKDGEFGVTASS